MARFRYERGDQPLEGYTVEHGLGVGGFGEVYFAISDSGREVALKAVQNYQEIELRGIRNCMNLKSPHLVTIFDVKHNLRGDPFVIMEYVNGPCLRTLLDNDPAGLGPTKAAFFLREIAKGLTYLHDAGVVHRDLKPHNVFYEEGYVKIGDYSLCKLISNTQNTGHTMTVGSVHYMAPEISQGRYDSSVDIYALGAMLFEMLTGTPPFTGDSVGEVLMKQLNDEPNVSRIEEPFRSVVKRALAKDPDERYASAVDMVEDIYGSQNIQNSVVAFNPQELTLVAGKVAGQAERIGVGGNGGSAGSGRSPVGFESGDASAWKRQSDSSVPYATAATQDTDATSKTIVRPKVKPISLLYEVDDGRPLGKDKMPVPLRYAMGFGVASAMSIATAPNDGNVGGYVMFVICATAIAFSLLRENYLRYLSPRNQILPRLLLSGILVAVPLFATLFNRDVARPMQAFGIVGLLPLLLPNVHGLTHARRAPRLRFAPIVIAALAAVVLGSLVHFGDPKFIPIPMAIAAGSLLTIQLVSPVGTLSMNGARHGNG